MTTTTITWTRVADRMPDDEQTVLLALPDGDVITGWHDGDDGWRDIQAWLLPAVPVYWAEMPAPPEAPR